MFVRTWRSSARIGATLAVNAVKVAIDDAMLIGRRHLLLDTCAGELHREIGGVFDELALR
jgi:hypothetical protein